MYSFLKGHRFENIVDRKIFFCFEVNITVYRAETYWIIQEREKFLFLTASKTNAENNELWENDGSSSQEQSGFSIQFPH